MPSSRETEAPERAREAAELAVELERLRDRYLRARADLENYRKRSQQEIDRRVAEGRDRILLDWLEVVDSVDRALHIDEGSSVAEGLRAVLGQMQGVLGRHGVDRVDAVGEPFDPELHEAVGTRADPEAPERTVVDIARTGYRVGERILRPAQVIVSERREEVDDDDGDA